MRQDAKRIGEHTYDDHAITSVKDSWLTVFND